MLVSPLHELDSDSLYIECLGACPAGPAIFYFTAPFLPHSVPDPRSFFSRLPLPRPRPPSDQSPFHPTPPANPWFFKCSLLVIALLDGQRFFFLVVGFPYNPYRVTTMIAFHQPPFNLPPISEACLAFPPRFVLFRYFPFDLCFSLILGLWFEVFWLQSLRSCCYFLCHLFTPTVFLLLLCHPTFFFSCFHFFFWAVVSQRAVVVFFFFAGCVRLVGRVGFFVFRPLLAAVSYLLCRLRSTLLFSFLREPGRHYQSSITDKR